MGLFPDRKVSGRWWRRHSLSIVLFFILVVQSWVFHATRLPEWKAEQEAHGESTKPWPEYYQHYVGEWTLSALADTYGVLLVVLLTKWFYEKDSDAAKDPEDDSKES